MKLNSHTILIAAQALATLSMVIILALAAKRCFFFADIRIIMSESAQQQGCFSYPPSEEEVVQMHRAMSIARQESTTWKELGKLLLLAQSIPVVMVGTLLCSVSMQKKKQENAEQAAAQLLLTAQTR
jgi:hypothetical protein